MTTRTGVPRSDAGEDADLDEVVDVGLHERPRVAGLGLAELDEERLGEPVEGRGPLAEQREDAGGQEGQRHDGLAEHHAADAVVADVEVDEAAAAYALPVVDGIGAEE